MNDQEQVAQTPQQTQAIVLSISVSPIGICLLGVSIFLLLISALFVGISYVYGAYNIITSRTDLLLVPIQGCRPA